MEHIPDRIDSKFRYVLLSAHRAEQLIRGAQPKLDKPDKPTSTAMREIIKEVVEWDYGQPEPENVATDEEADADVES